MREGRGCERVARHVEGEFVHRLDGELSIRLGFDDLVVLAHEAPPKDLVLVDAPVDTRPPNPRMPSLRIWVSVLFDRERHHGFIQSLLARIPSYYNPALGCAQRGGQERVDRTVVAQIYIGLLGPITATASLLVCRRPLFRPSSDTW